LKNIDHSGRWLSQAFFFRPTSYRSCHIVIFSLSSMTGIHLKNSL